LNSFSDQYSETPFPDVGWITEKPTYRNQIVERLQRCQSGAAIGDEGHDDAESGTHNERRLLCILHVNPNEQQTFAAEDGCGDDDEVRVGMKNAGEDKQDGAEKFEDAKGCPERTRECAEAGTSLLTLSKRNTFMMPEEAKRSAARICSIHNRMFMDGSVVSKWTCESA
jgi:hypothetical protein